MIAPRIYPPLTTGFADLVPIYHARIAAKQRELKIIQMEAELHANYNHGVQSARQLESAALIGVGAPLLVAGGAAVGGYAGAASVTTAMGLDVGLRNHLGKPLSPTSTFVNGGIAIGFGAASMTLSTVSGGTLAAKTVWTVHGEVYAFGAGNIATTGF